MRVLLGRGSRAAVVPACLLLFTLACEREPGILINIAAWPDKVERIRVRTRLEGTEGTEIFLDKAQTRFAVRFPAQSQGEVQLDAVGFDAESCKLVLGSMVEPVPRSLSGFVERTLDLTPLPSPVCMLADPISFPVGPGPQSVVGDFNRDAKSDLALVVDSNNVSVFLGNGMGGFATAANFATGGSNPAAVAIGDFNADMNPDLVVVNRSSRNVSVLLGNGLGGFAASTNFATDSMPLSRPSAVAVGDFNGDMKPDLAVADSYNSQVSVLVGNGVGGFAAATHFATGPSPAAVAAGDLNGDMKLDLAFTSSTSDNVSVLLGNGMGGFAAATFFPVGAVFPRSVAVGDFNGDMKLDLVVTKPATGSNNVGVILGNGAGGFGAVTNFIAGNGPYAVAGVDLNGDMKLDLAVTNESSNDVSVLLNDGMGGFSAALRFSAAGSLPRSIAVGDFNGDMKPDLAVANALSDNVTILLNQFEEPRTLR